MWTRKYGPLLLGMTLAYGPQVTADDTELFVYDFAQAGDYRPKVLFIFDNSGSMNSTVETVQEPYDPAVSYPLLPGDSSSRDNHLYFTDQSSVPAITSDQRFSNSLNACAESVSSLGTQGYFLSGFGNLEIYDNGNKSKWAALKNFTEDTITLADCSADIAASNTGNNGVSVSLPCPVIDGYPIKPGNGNNGTICYTTDKSQAVSTNGNGANVTLYTANYLRWYHGGGGTVTQTRLQVVKSAVSDLISSTPGVDFGLMVFNYNHWYSGLGIPESARSQGGRVIRKIAGNDDILANGKTGKQDLLDIFDDLPAQTNTPLCETLYEAYRYFGGKTVLFGDDETLLLPPRDLTAEDPLLTYKSPYDSCANNAYIIYLSDGSPTDDSAANAQVEALINGLPANEKAAYGGQVGYGSGNATSWLAALAGYMKNNDVNTGAEGKQTVTTFTVGFGDDAISGAGNLLAETARRGGGEYYPALDAAALSQALKASMLAILKINSSLVSPAITSNNFDRTRSLDNIYYAMFEPGIGPRWKGNLKKLAMSGDGYIADQNGLPAISTSGVILDSAQTYWSSGTDGNLVGEGGVQEMLAGKAADTRNLYVLGGAGQEPFTRTKLEEIAGDTAALMSHMQVTTTGELDTLLSWVKGVDVDDEDNDGSNTDNRPYILGDPLHSRPMVINYGPPSGNKEDAPDLRILMGTNAGFLHLFKDLGDTVDESWALIPYEFLANQQDLRNNFESASHIYGVDASPVALIKDANNNGVIKASETDSVWLFTGLRRGGKAYYGFDLSSPDSPSLMWSFDQQTTEFGLLGETWSEPELGFIPGETDPVLIFGGGYDVNKDAEGQGTADSTGAGIYMVNARTGVLVFSATPAAASTSNLQVTAMTDSMPGAVTVMDSDHDGKLDRVYAGDTGGNIWRMDMVGTTKSNWSVFKFASLGSDSTLTQDRRFFSQPVIARTINQQITKTVIDEVNYYGYKERAFDAVLIGSGDRTRPASESTVRNGYFMLRDYNIKTKRFDETNTPNPLVIGDLYDITSDPLSAQTTYEDILDVKAGITGKDGWVYWLDANGEKAFGSGIVLEGKLYFTSFIPEVQSFQQCSIQSIGTMRQYMVDMHYGTSFKYVLDLEGNQTSTPERYVEVLNKVADDLLIHAGHSGKVYLLGGAPGKEVILKADEGEDEPERCTDAGECSGGADEVDMDLSPQRVYLYEGETQ